MTPKLARKSGLRTSFFRSIGYCCHDKDASTTKRVAAIELLNLAARTPEEAAQEMTATFKQARKLKIKAGLSTRGRKGRRPALHLSLSWAPHEKPTHKQMISAAKECIEAIGYKDHQAVLVIHNDEPQPHIHIILSRVYPVTGVMVKPSYLKLKLSRWAEAYERRKGKIRCKQRVRNNRKRDQGKIVRYCPPVIAKAWESTTNGKGFAKAIKASGYILARGDSCPYVVVDPYGDVINPTRQIADARAADIRARFADIDPKGLPSVEEAKERAAQWRERQQAKEARRKAKAKRYRRNWESRRKRRQRPRTATPIQKPQRSPYRPQEEKAVSEHPKAIQAPVRASMAFYTDTKKPNSSSHDPPVLPPCPIKHHWPALTP